MDAIRRDRRLLKEFQAIKAIASPDALFSFTCDVLLDSEAIRYLNADNNPSIIGERYHSFFTPEEFEAQYPGRVPEKYLIRYTCTGLAWPEGAQAPQKSNEHRMLLIYGWKFPEEPPLFVWQTPIWHPNIYHSRICLIDHHFAMSVSLADIVIEVGRLIQYQRYNLNNPYHREATEWTHQHMHELPIDKRDILSAQKLSFTIKSQRNNGIVATDEDESDVEIV